MKVEIWSDFVCPFCYIGKRRLEEALGKFEHGAEVEVSFRSFQLSPNIPVDGNPDAHEMLMSKYGMSREQVEANTAGIVQQAKDVGLDFDFEASIQTNTFDAHRLAHFAAAEGKGLAYTERVLRAHFTEGLHIGRHDVLADLAAEAGIDREKALAVLDSDKYAEAVKADIGAAAELGIRGVPFFVLAGKYGVSGAQPPEVFLQALGTAWAEKGD